MTRVWSHEEAYAEIGAAALDALAPEERAGLEAHVASCAECRAELQVMADVAGKLAGAVPERAMDPARNAALRSRLLDRTRSDTPQIAPISVRRPPPRDRAPSAVDKPQAGSSEVRPPTTAPWWFAAAASILFLLSTAAFFAARNRAAALSQELAAATVRSGELETSLADRERTLAALSGSDVKVVELVSTGTPPTARMFWAQASNTWTMFAHDLPAPPAGKTYQLWLITRDGTKISAGTFAPSANGDAIVQAQYALARDSLQMIAVTDEPTGGVPQPTGSIIIAGAAGQ